MSIPTLTLNSISAVATELATIINAHAGDYPLVSFPEEKTGPMVVWLYAHLVVQVFVVTGESASIRSHKPGGVEVEVPSLRCGMELLRRTECICQNVDWPYVQLNYVCAVPSSVGNASSI